MVSANFPTALLTVYRIGNSFSQEQTTLKLKKLQFTRVDKILAISIQITFEQSTATIAQCLRIPREENECQRRIKFYYLHIIVM